MQTAQVMPSLGDRVMSYQPCLYQLSLDKSELRLMGYLMSYAHVYCQDLLTEMGHFSFSVGQPAAFFSLMQIALLKKLILRAVTTEEIYRFAKREAKFYAVQERDYIEIHELDEEPKSWQTLLQNNLAYYDGLLCVKLTLLAKLQKLNEGR